MNFKTTLISLSALFLVACFPAKEISSDNAERIVATANALTGVSDYALAGFTTRIDNRSLERLLVSKTASPVAGDCTNSEGTYLFSLSADHSGVSMVFDQCRSESGHTISGTVNGSVIEADGVVSVQLTGDLDVRSGSDRIALAPMTLSLTLTATDTEFSVFLSQHGTYVFDTSGFRGQIDVVTEQPVGCNVTSLTCSGAVTYRDAKGNALRVDHDNNGVHLYVNGAYLRSYTHREWRLLS